MDKKIEIDPHVIHADDFDRNIWDDLTGDSKTIKDLSQKGKELVNGNFPPLIDDVFQALYQYKPEYSHNSDHPIIKRNKVFLEELLSSSDYERFREYSSMDEFSSVLSTCSLTQSLIEQLEKDESMRDQFKQQGSDESGDDNQKDDQPENDQGDDQGDGKDGQKDQQNSQQQGDKSGKGQGKSDKNSNQRRAFRKAIRQAISKAEKDLNESQQIMNGYGLGDSDLEHMSFDERKGFIDRLRGNKHIKKISDLAGRLHRILHKAKVQRTRNVPEEVVNVTLGNDISRLTPNEYLMMEEAPLDWNRRFVNRELQQYELEGQEKIGRGPIIVCVDKSGSMGGERDSWATAVVFSILKEAQKEKRTFCYCAFNSRIKHTEKVEGKNVDIQDLIRLAEIGVGGGTDFEKPLKYALKEIKADKDLKEADIIFVTDGDAFLTDQTKQELNDQKKIQDVNIYTVLIGNSFADDAHALKEISDECFNLDDVLNEEKQSDAMYGLVRTLKI